MNDDGSPAKKKQKRGDDDGVASDGECSGSDAGDVAPAPEPPAEHAAAGSSKPKPKTSIQKTRNAFQEMMAAKPKPKSNTKPTFHQSSDKIRLDPREPRDALGEYILRPEKHPTFYNVSENRKQGVIQYDENFVTIWDNYPKGTVHILLLSRDPKVAHSHPIEAFDDPDFLAAVKEKAKELRSMAGSELQRLFVKDSATEIKRREFLEKLEEQAAVDPDLDFDAEALKAPPGRDWEKCIKVGIHARPSMNHFHVHIISQDMHSPRVKKKMHYQSFNTGFFVNLDEFPLSEDDERRPGVGSCKGHVEGDCICWRCGNAIGGRKGGGMDGLREHMAMEFKEWKKI